MCLFFSFQAGVRGMKVEQSPSALSFQEGTSSTLRCNFSILVTYVQWFRQNPQGDITSLFYVASGTKHNGRLSATLHSKDLYSTLNTTTSRLEDSATYLCAADSQCCQVICSLYPNCSWACSPTLSMARHCAPTLGFAHLWVFKFMIQTSFLS
uniref:Ig-like domain-containing protein n=1 Tax=Pipistrellus kuhlii TaxID=59472 RepID=A0A7J8B146_PIPKU|nr:hypothetical protein mPipKuh1_007731 [Pipistrellus kuhlii]